MAGEPFDRDVLADGFDDFTRAPGRAGADRVADRDFVATHRIELARDAYDRFRVDVTFVRTAETYGDIAANFQSARKRCAADFGEARETFGDRAVGIALRKALGRCAEY